jgi:hypothetical protein
MARQEPRITPAMLRESNDRVRASGAPVTRAIARLQQIETAPEGTYTAKDKIAAVTALTDAQAQVGRLQKAHTELLRTYEAQTERDILQAQARRRWPFGRQG